MHGAAAPIAKKAVGSSSAVPIAAHFAAGLAEPVQHVVSPWGVSGVYTEEQKKEQ